MSYCRWSTNDFQCDLYCYEDVAGGFTTHVASNRTVGTPPHERWAEFIKKEITAEEMVADHQALMKWLETAEHKPIGLPHDGETFNDATLEEFLVRLMALKKMGYRFPEHVIETVIEEINEQDKK